MLKYFPTFKNVGRFFRNNITRPGRTLLFLLFFSSIGLVYLDTPLVFLFSAVLTILSFSAAVSFLFRPNLDCKLVTPELVQANAEIKADIYLKNLRNRSAFEIFIDANPGVDDFQLKKRSNDLSIGMIAPKRTEREDLFFSFKQRGIYTFPSLSVGSTFPFNLFRFRQNKQFSERIIVTPTFKDLVYLEVPKSHHAIDFENEKTVKIAASAGASEYVGNREYQTGMPVRRWDFSSWARTGKPIIREFRENQRGDAMVFVDSFFEAPKSKSTKEKFELILSLTAAIANELANQHIEIANLVIGNKVFPISFSSIEEQLVQVGRVLAEVEPTDEAKSSALLDEEFVQRATENGSIAILLFARVDETRTEFANLVAYETPNNIQVFVNDGVTVASPRFCSVTFDQIKEGNVVVQ